MKYKVGDKVKIRSWDDMEQEYGLDDFGCIKLPKRHFMIGMKKCCEKVVTIEIVYLNSYSIKEDDYNWTDNMIDHVATKIMSIIARLEMLKKLIKNSSDIDNYYFHNINIQAINIRIENLKSNNPCFSKTIAKTYNNIFREYFSSN